MCWLASVKHWPSERDLSYAHKNVKTIWLTLTDDDVAGDRDGVGDDKEHLTLVEDLMWQDANAKCFLWHPYKALSASLLPPSSLAYSAHAFTVRSVSVFFFFRQHRSSYPSIHPSKHPTCHPSVSGSSWGHHHQQHNIPRLSWFMASIEFWLTISQAFKVSVSRISPSLSHTLPTLSFSPYRFRLGKVILKSFVSRQMSLWLTALASASMNTSGGWI